MNQGLIHLYTGEGKGKTTAAAGLLLRAYGRGRACVLVQFLKGGDTGEVIALARLPGLTILRNAKDYGFYHAAAPAEQEAMIQAHNDHLATATRLVGAGQCQLLVLDEVCAAYHLNALDRAAVDGLIAQKPPELELVLTGRNPPPAWVKAADYVTEFVKRKHPYDRGLGAREGIEL